MPSYMNSTGQQAAGNDITGTSDAIVVASVPDVALPMESEPGVVTGISDGRARPSLESGTRAGVVRGGKNSLPIAIAAAGAAGLLMGMVLKKSLPAVKGRC